MRGCLVALAMIVPFWTAAFVLTGWRGLLALVLVGAAVELLAIVLVGVAIELLIFSPVLLAAYRTWRRRRAIERWHSWHRG